MLSTASYSAFWLLTDIAGLYGVSAPLFRRECTKRGITLKGKKEKYSPKEVNAIIDVLGRPMKASEV